LSSADLYDSTHHLDQAAEGGEKSREGPGTQHANSGEKAREVLEDQDTEDGKEVGEDSGARGTEGGAEVLKDSGAQDVDGGEKVGEVSGAQATNGRAEGRGESSTKAWPNPYEPFPNPSSFDLGEWFYGQGPQKSLKDFKALIQVLTSPGFSLDDIRKTKWTRVFQDLGKNKEEINPKYSNWVDDAGWKTTDITLEVPIHNKIRPGRGVEAHVAGKLFHRSIVSIVEEKIRNTQDCRLFHYDGHELLWNPDPKSTSEFRLMSELYHSDAFLNAQKEVNDNPPPEIKDCPLPRVVVGLMFWSDATHVSTFSTCKVWPLYMLFANESKYRRAKNGTDLCNHVAYFDAVCLTPSQRLQHY
jgi:hypothetical protein